MYIASALLLRACVYHNTPARTYAKSLYTTYTCNDVNCTCLSQGVLEIIIIYYYRLGNAYLIR